jgi:hypothetical protein
MRLRPLITGFLLGCGCVTAAVAVALRLDLLHRSVPTAAAAPGMDWSRVSDLDLSVASLFLTAKRGGVGPAMDSLAAVAARDRQIAALGHPLAHGLGRYAVALAGGDPAVFAQCTPAFSSGCYHGVLEGYLAASDSAARQPLDRLCDAVAAGEPPYARRECAHGLGHALMGINRGRTPESLRGCDRLPDRADRYDCWEGVYMEEVVRVAGVAVINAGDAAAAHHHSGGHRPAERVDCADEPAAYRAACWAYQPVLLFDRMNRDAARTLRACRQAPDPASVESCRIGVGKQTAGRMPQRADSLAAICAADGTEAEASCLDGAVEFYVEQRWDAAPGVEFCAAIPERSRGSCFESLGAHAAMLHPTAQAAMGECARVPAAYAAACRRGAAAPRS